MHVAAVAFISNHAAGMTEEKLSHQEVLARSAQNASLFPLLLKLMIETWQAASARKTD
jgi:purine nucleoside phosphorylase